MPDGYARDAYEYREVPGYPFFYEDEPHIGHRNHLCDIAKRGVVDLETYKKLVGNSKFICKKCGRVAEKAENLCEPVPL